MYKKLHLYLVIVASICMTIVNIYLKADLVTVCYRLILVIVIFYVISVIAANYINKEVFPPPESEIIDDDMPEGTEVENLDIDPNIADDYELPSDDFNQYDDYDENYD